MSLDSLLSRLSASCLANLSACLDLVQLIKHLQVVQVSTLSVQLSRQFVLISRLFMVSTKLPIPPHKLLTNPTALSILRFKLSGLLFTLFDYYPSKHVNCETTQIVNPVVQTIFLPIQMFFLATYNISLAFKMSYLTIYNNCLTLQTNYRDVRLQG